MSSQKKGKKQTVCPISETMKYCQKPMTLVNLNDDPIPMSLDDPIPMSLDDPNPMSQWFHLDQDQELNIQIGSELNDQEYSSKSILQMIESQEIQDGRIKMENSGINEPMAKKKQKIYKQKNSPPFEGGGQLQESKSLIQESSEYNPLDQRRRRGKTMRAGLQKSILPTVGLIIQQYLKKNTIFQYKWSSLTKKQAFDDLFKVQELRPPLQRMFRSRHMSRAILLKKIKKEYKNIRLIRKLQIVRTLEKAFHERQKLHMLFRYQSQPDLR